MKQISDNRDSSRKSFLLFFLFAAIINSDERAKKKKKKFSFQGNLAQRSKGAYSCVEICSKSSVFEKVNKNSGFTNCVASMFNHIAAGHGNSRNICWAFVGGDSIFAVGYTFPMV